MGNDKEISGKVRCPPIKQLKETKWDYNYKHKRDCEYVSRNNCTQFIGRKIHRNIQEKQNNMEQKQLNFTSTNNEIYNKTIFYEITTGFSQESQ